MNPLTRRQRGSFLTGPIVVVSLVIIAFTAIDARAQMSMGSFKGYLTGHVGAISGGELTNERLAAGASVSVQEQGGWGAELDFGHASDAVAGRQRLDINTYLINAAWVRPMGLVRPFAVVGAGVLQIDGCDTCNGNARTHDLGISAGGGAFVAMTDWAGARADVRYFFSGGDHANLGRPDNFSFWRISVGATFMWDITP
jgi:hypothetical protein